MSSDQVERIARFQSREARQVRKEARERGIGRALDRRFEEPEARRVMERLARMVEDTVERQKVLPEALGPLAFLTTQEATELMAARAYRELPFWTLIRFLRSFGHDVLLEVVPTPQGAAGEFLIKQGHA